MGVCSWQAQEDVQLLLPTSRHFPAPPSSSTRACEVRIKMSHFRWSSFIHNIGIFGYLLVWNILCRFRVVLLFILSDFFQFSPPFGGVTSSVYLSVNSTIYLSVYSSIYLSVYYSIFLFVYIFLSTRKKSFVLKVRKSLSTTTRALQILNKYKKTCILAS